MRKAIPTIVILILIGVLGTVFFRTYVVKYSYSAEKADLNAYYGEKHFTEAPKPTADDLGTVQDDAVKKAYRTGRKK